MSWSGPSKKPSRDTDSMTITRFMTATLPRSPERHYDDWAAQVPRPSMRFVRAVSVGVTVWLLAGTAVACVLAVVLGDWSNGFAISGLVLVLGSLGWVLG